MSDKTHNIQDLYLNSLRRKKIPVTMYLTNGVKLQGVVGSFDNFCVVLKRSGQTQLVYKQAVATVVPATPLSLSEISDTFEPDSDEDIANGL